MRRLLVISSLFVTAGYFAVSCGSKSDDTAASTPAIAFADANTIIKASCSASGCHGKTGAKSTIFEDNQTNFDAAKTNCKTRVAATTNPMPPTDSPALTTAAKATLLSYCAQ